MPVVVYPKKYLNELRDEIIEVKSKTASGEQPVFDNVDALFDKLEAEYWLMNLLLHHVFKNILSGFMKATK